MRTPKYPVRCPDCKELAGWVEDIEQPSGWNDLCGPEPVFLGWQCEECGWEDEAEEDELLNTYSPEPEQLKKSGAMLARIFTAAHVKTYETPNLEDIFEYAPEGDFKWDGEPSEDWSVYSCGEKDCPVGWHLTSDWMDMGRENGKRYIEIGTTDSDGDSDPSGRWEDGDDWEASDVSWDLARGSDSYFKGWAEYWLSAAIYGNDPVNNYTGENLPPNEWAEYCLKAAEDNMKYYFMSLK